MGMSIEDIIQGLKETYIICCSVFAYDRKKYIDGAIDRLNKYQMMQADYEARLRVDMVAMLTEIQLEIEEVPKYCMTHDATCVYRKAEEYIFDINNVIQQKITSLKEEST